MINTAPAVVLDGATDIMVVFAYTAFGQDSTTAVSRLSLFDAFNGGAAATLGLICASRAWIAILSAVRGQTLKVRLAAPAAGSHVYSVRGWVSAASTFRVAGGDGSVGNRDMPNSLTILELP